MSNLEKRKKRKWSPQEDEILKSSIQKLYEGRLPQSSEISWAKLKDDLPQRSTLQIRERYSHILNPYVNRTRVTKEEILLVLKYKQIYGNKWSLIAGHLPGRTSLLVKNSFYSALRRFKRHYERHPANSKELVNFFETKILGRKPSEDIPSEFGNLRSPLSEPSLCSKESRLSTDIQHESLSTSNGRTNIMFGNERGPSRTSIMTRVSRDSVITSPIGSAPLISWEWYENLNDFYCGAETLLHGVSTESFGYCMGEKDCFPGMPKQCSDICSDYNIGQLLSGDTDLMEFEDEALIPNCSETITSYSLVDKLETAFGSDVSKVVKYDKDLTPKHI